MVDFILLVRTDFQTYMGDAGIMKGRDDVGYELQNRFLFVSRSKHNQVMWLELIEDVLFGIVMDYVIGGVYRATLKGKSGRNNGNEDYTVDVVPIHERSPRNERIGARAVVLVISSVC